MLDKLKEVTGGVAWDRVLFSAKESIFKAWFPLSGRWLDYQDCELHIGARSGTFIGLLTDERSRGVRYGGVAVRGRWSVHGAHVMTAVCISV